MLTRSVLTALIAGAACLVAASCATALLPDPNTYQGWGVARQDEWYAATQGSRLMPLSWMRALEQADSARPFLAEDNVARFRLLPRPGALPVGFAADDGSDEKLTVSKLRWFAGQGPTEKWVGLNCAACHTAHIAYGAQDLRIDGGPSLFDYQSFVEAVDASLKATLASAEAADPAARAKWERFSTAVLGCEKGDTGCVRTGGRWSRDDAKNRDLLLTGLRKLVTWEDKVERLNRTPLRYGYGRVDAFGHIFNKIALFNLDDHPSPNPADAPVSYPFLWEIHRQNRLQWNGMVEALRIPLGRQSLDFGALGRNAGEVIGVFGDVAVKEKAGLGGYDSSIDVRNLEDLERMLMVLGAPPWPASTFGPIKGDVEEGRRLFADHCQFCHKPQPGQANYDVKIVPLVQGGRESTDPWMACNSIRYTSLPGKLAGTPVGYLGRGPRYEAGRDAQLADMLSTTVKGALAGKKGKIVLQAGRVFLGVDGHPHVVSQEELTDVRGAILAACYAQKSPRMAYKARPLDGIWATAPYLHNGSVASLEQLLLAPSNRLKSFKVGTRQYDPAAGGYSIDPAAPGNAFTFETAKPGNSNAGHDYGVGGLPDAKRAALLAYLKTL